MDNSGLRWRIQGVISPTSYIGYKGLLRKTNARFFAQRQVTHNDKFGRKYRVRLSICGWYWRYLNNMQSKSYGWWLPAHLGEAFSSQNLPITTHLNHPKFSPGFSSQMQRANNLAKRNVQSGKCLNIWQWIITVHLDFYAKPARNYCKLTFSV